jgi:glycosyltransferase involved in cell wall biosynthesis
MNGISEAQRNKIRIIHVITRFDKGGSAENTFLSVHGLDRRRYDTWLIQGSSQESRMGSAEHSAVEQNLLELEQLGVHIITLPDMVRSISPFKDAQAFLRLIRIFRQIKPQIVHTHTSKAGFLGRWAACLSRVPIIVHNPHGHVFWGYFNTPISRLFIILERMTGRITNRLVMLTEQEKEDHLLFRIAPERKFAVIHSGVDFRPFTAPLPDPDHIRQQFKIPSESFVIGSVGRLTPVKGHRYLLEAMARLMPRHQNLACVILGDGELREELQALAQQLHIGDRVFLPGWHADVAPVLSMFDIFAFPSINEGMGKGIVEAMAMGKPVVASAVGGIVNLVTPGESGLLISPGDAEILAKTIELLYHDEGLRQKMGEAGKERAASFSSALMVKKVDALYAELIAEFSPPEKRKL